MSAMEVKVFRLRATVGFFEADVKLRMAPAAYWRILQNAAAGHAALLSAATEELRRGGQTWMLSKMRLDVMRHPSLGETVEVETWPSTRIKGARAYRDFVLRDESGEICATASSLWVIVDLASRRPVRIPEAIVALCHDPGYLIPPMEEGWLTGPEQVQGETEFTSYWSDADQNEHVNNVTMVRWAVDALPLEYLELHEVVSVEAQYRAEVKVGEVVRVRRERVGDLVRQEVLNEAGVAVALVHTRWRVSG